MDVKGPLCGFEVFLDALPPSKVKAGAARPMLKASSFQAVSRDFAFVVSSHVPAENLGRAIRGVDRALITEVSVFDLYEGENLGSGRKSLAVAVTLQPMDRTLTDAEIDAVSKRIIEAVEKATGGELRG